MKLLIQPEDGIGPLIKEIDAVRKSIEIVVFHFDHVDVQRATPNCSRSSSAVPEQRKMLQKDLVGAKRSRINDENNR